MMLGPILFSACLITALASSSRWVNGELDRDDDFLKADNNIILSMDFRDLLANPGRFPPYGCSTCFPCSPFELSPPQVVNGQICFTASTKIPTQVSPCNTMDFYKLEIAVRECNEGCMMDVPCPAIVRSFRLLSLLIMCYPPIQSLPAKKVSPRIQSTG